MRQFTWLREDATGAPLGPQILRRPHLHPIAHFIPRHHLRPLPIRPLAAFLGVPFPPLLGVPVRQLFLHLYVHYPLRLLGREDRLHDCVGCWRDEAAAGGAAGGGGKGGYERGPGGLGVGGIAAAVVKEDRARCLGSRGGEIGECWYCCLGSRRSW